MKIEKIKKLKSGKYKLELDNNEKITTYDDVILNNNLLFDKNVSNELLNKLNIDTAYYDIYYKLVKLIATKMRSKYEIENYLNKNGIDEIEQKKIINDLVKIGLINDVSYVKAFISDKIHLTNDGPLKIKKLLIDNKIEEEIIDEELSQYDDEIFKEKINKYINKKKQNNKYSEFIFKQKILNELINLGYSKDMIQLLLNEINIENNNLILKEYEKAKNSLSKKYGGKELENKIKNKLYQKGFKLDEINEYIQKSEY